MVSFTILFESMNINVPAVLVLPPQHTTSILLYFTDHTSSPPISLFTQHSQQKQTKTKKQTAGTSHTEQK